MQFKVPQDVQRPDRIVGPLTLVQLIICVIGGSTAYAIYIALQKQEASMIFWLPPVLFVAAITAAFAFLKISNLPFHSFLALLIERFLTPSKRVWIKGADHIETGQKILSREEERESMKKQQQLEEVQEKEKALQNISTLMGVLNTEPKPTPPKKQSIEDLIAPPPVKPTPIHGTTPARRRYGGGPTPSSGRSETTKQSANQVLPTKAAPPLPKKPAPSQVIKPIQAKSTPQPPKPVLPPVIASPAREAKQPTNQQSPAQASPVPPKPQTPTPAPLPATPDQKPAISTPTPAPKASPSPVVPTEPKPTKLTNGSEQEVTLNRQELEQGHSVNFSHP